MYKRRDPVSTTGSLLPLAVKDINEFDLAPPRKNGYAVPLDTIRSVIDLDAFAHFV